MQGCEDDLLTPVRMAQIGTRHGHAQGKWLAQCSNQDVEAVGIWEPDPLNRTQAQAKQGFAGARWLDSADEVLGDPSVVAVAIEGRNHESLAMAQAAIDAGKHLWFDKPAGDDWPGFVRLLDQAAARNTHVQMGYMFRYSPGFDQIASWARGGLLGELFAVRAHMSTHVDLTERTEQTRHRGGILYDLGGHMIDQIVWLLGRQPASAASSATTRRRNCRPTRTIPWRCSSSNQPSPCSTSRRWSRGRQRAALKCMDQKARLSSSRSTQRARYVWPSRRRRGLSRRRASHDLAGSVQAAVVRTRTGRICGRLARPAAAGPPDRARAAGSGNPAARNWPDWLTHKGYGQAG